jgi:hypothetical protein
MRMKRSLCGLLLLSNLEGTAIAQAPSSQASVVRIPVVVSGPKGSPVLNLKQEDFKLFEGGVERPILSFIPPNQPIHVDIILATTRMKGSRTAGGDLIFDSIDRFKQVGNPANTYTIEELPQGTNGLVDAIERHVEKLSQSANPRRALVVIPGAGPEPINAVRKLGEKVRTMGVPIYIRHGAGLCTQTTIVELGNCSDTRLAYDELSENSGGHPIRPFGNQVRDELLLELAEELRNQYVVGFQPAGAPDNKWRTVEIRVTGTLTAKAAGRHFAAKPR